jgi:hypothetical protein
VTPTTPPTTPRPTTPTTTTPPTARPALDPVVWDAAGQVLRVTLVNRAEVATGHLVLGAELDGAAAFTGDPVGCRLPLRAGATASCGLTPIPAGERAVIEFPIEVTAAGATAHVTLCEVRLLSASCDTPILEEETVDLVPPD